MEDIGVVRQIVALFLQNGLIGAVSLLAMGIAWKMFRRYEAEKDKRIADREAMIPVLRDVAESLEELTHSIDREYHARRRR